MHQVLEVVNFTSLKYKNFTLFLTLCMLVHLNLCVCCHLLTFFLILTFSFFFFSFFSNTKSLRESNSFDPDQDQPSVGPDLGLTVCKGKLQMAKFTDSKERVKQVNSILTDNLTFPF